jgi:hypothetical protein
MVLDCATADCTDAEIAAMRDEAKDEGPNWTDAEIAAMRDEAQARVDQLDAIFADVADDPRVVREASRCESAAMCTATTDRFRSYVDGDVAAYVAATRHVHTAALAQARALAAARESRIASIAAIAEATDTTIPPRLAAIQSRARRAVADLACRLHGLIHPCLLAARVSTAQAATVATG